MASITPIQGSDVEDWANFRDDDIMQQQSAIQAVEAEKIPLVGDKGRKLCFLLAMGNSGALKGTDEMWKCNCCETIHITV
ncbi:hypothetical protein CsSME_00042857 [Camellia sinensis var. sinensis]